MADDDLRDQISRIETDIEEYAVTLEGCRKAMLLSKVAIAAGIISFWQRICSARSGSIPWL